MTLCSLPPEIIGRIFVLCLPTDLTRKVQKTDAPVILTRVCLRWYYIAIETPRLWSTIALLPSRYPTTTTLILGAHYLELCLSRAKTLALDLYLHVALIAHSPTYALLQGISHRISTFSVLYPDTVSGIGSLSYFPQDHFSTPNLTSFEIHVPETHGALTKSDLAHLCSIVQSCSLKRIFFCYPYVLTYEPIQTNWSTLQELRFTPPIPLALGSYILRNAPSLREASFTWTYFTSDPTSDGRLTEALLAGLPSVDLTNPHIHPTLETLLIAHGDISVLETFFHIFTLPRLQNLLLLAWTNDDPWPQAIFLDFLQRSRCSMKQLWMYYEPLSSGQLIQVLESPAVNDSLMALSVQKDRSPPIFDGSVVKKLTFSPSPGGRRLCPKLQMLGIYDTYSFSFEEFVAMLNSRLDCDRPFSPSIDVPPPRSHVENHAYLRYLEMDDSPLTRQYLKSLISRGLLTVLYDTGPGRMRVPLEDQERVLLQKYVSEGLVLWEHNSTTGEWGPNYDI